MPDNHERALLPIPIKAAEAIAKKYGYDQVVVLARRVGEFPSPSGEHITTYGIDKTHCEVAAMMGNTLKRIAQWPSEQDVRDLNALYIDLVAGTFDYSDHDETSRRLEALRRLLGEEDYSK